ncbi:MAG: class I tRNA ligase family protein [Candidatus Paceibacterota bacterium]|nr:MAG: class I tRNA ligase family protein [Candidatus Paceibacterota bacterium]
MQNNRFYITTAIPYVNAQPHIGFALELVQADALARYHRMLGEDVRLVNGSDENALKNVQAAEKAGVSVQAFVDEHAQRFQGLSDVRVLNISNDDFIRTTEERHVRGAQKLWAACKKEDIYKKTYDGLYCVGCEEFKTPKELIDGLCPEHRVAPERVAEENYFFRLSHYQNALLELIESGALTITPSTRKNEVLSFIREGLEDFSISRSVARAKGWGIDVPGDSSQKMYVWFDALTNYITALGYADNAELFQRYWLENDQRVHLVGKGITRFHAIYWPAMLLSAGLPVPSTILVHGYVTVDGEKISKSLGNGIDPYAAVEQYRTDVVRYFLLREIPSGEDGDFSFEKLKARYAGDLANGLGNLVQRTAVLAQTKIGDSFMWDLAGERRSEHWHFVHADENYHAAFQEFRLHDAVADVWKKIATVNQYINEEKPWALEAGERQRDILLHMIGMVAHIAWLLQPLMPETAQNIFALFGIESTKELIPGTELRIEKGEGLFPRLQRAMLNRPRCR